MGNCQAIDAATSVIQHPCGRVERWYWPVTVSEVMRLNPGHYVALVITMGLSESEEEEKKDKDGVRFTRVKLLRPTDTLVLGQAYRLITSEEVMKGLWAKKYAKMKKKKSESTEEQQRVNERKSSSRRVDSEKINQAEKHRQRATSSAVARSKPWRPSLQSISEVGS